MGSVTCMTPGATTIPGGNPVTEVPGLSPRSPPVIVVMRAVLVTVEPPRTLKPPAVSNGTGDEHATAEVVKVHVKLAASPLPNWSCAPVVMVAVKVVFRARPGGLAGVKVAVLLAGSKVTAPDTLPEGAVKVKVVVLIVAGFIALLNIAVTTALGQMPEEPIGGRTDGPNTVGVVNWEPALPPPLSASLHPTVTTANRIAGIHILLSLNLRIRVSSSPGKISTSVLAVCLKLNTTLAVRSLRPALSSVWVIAVCSKLHTPNQAATLWGDRRGGPDRSGLAAKNSRYNGSCLTISYLSIMEDTPVCPIPIFIFFSVRTTLLWAQTKTSLPPASSASRIRAQTSFAPGASASLVVK